MIGFPCLNPLLALIRNLHLTLSEAFWWSNLIASIPSFRFLLLKLWRISWSTTSFLANSLPGIHVDWLGAIWLLGHITISLIIVLHTTLHMLINQKWLKEVGFWIFGTRRISELFYLFWHSSMLRKLATTLPVTKTLPPSNTSCNTTVRNHQDLHAPPFLISRGLEFYIILSFQRHSHKVLSTPLSLEGNLYLVLKINPCI